MNPRPDLTIVVPSYNVESFLSQCLDSILAVHVPPGCLEVVVVDDGSSDGTAAIAERYARERPDAVSVVRKANGGHGSAINAGLEVARGRYFKVLDADDWVDVEALRELLAELARLRDGHAVDMVLSNFVYHHEGRGSERPVRFRGAVPRGRAFGWSEVRALRKTQYFLMHAITYDTELLRRTAFALPEHTFYVDNLFAFVPLSHVERIFYVDVDLYRYRIGREGQSVAEATMIRRIDQQLRVNRLMIEHLVSTVSRAPAATAYLLHYLEIVSAVTSTLLVKIGTEEALAEKAQLWRAIRDADADVYRRLRRSVLGQILHLPGRLGRSTIVAAYRLAQRRVGFN